MPATFGSLGSTVIYDSLFAGHNVAAVSDKGTLISGQNLTRGALLGRITASGKLTLSLSAAGDGSETPRYILVENTDASAGDKECNFYRTGEFNEAAITFGTGHTADSTREALADLGIFLKTNVPAQATP